MITFVAHLRVKPENSAAYEALMSYVTDQTLQQEPSVIYYGFGKSVDVADTYVVVEVYRDAASQAAHMASDWVQESLPRAALLIEGAPDIQQYVSMGAEPVRDRLFTSTQGDTGREPGN